MVAAVLLITDFPITRAQRRSNCAREGVAVLKRFMSIVCLILPAGLSWNLPASISRAGGFVRPTVEANTRTYYVDADAGQDSNDGQAQDRAWLSLERVNAAELKPGDTVRFRAGCVWRGSLIPVSGEEGLPITYTSFGDGPKPRILGSRPRGKAEDWVRVGEHVWATVPLEYRPGELLLDLQGKQWGHHQEGGARVKLTHVDDEAGTFVRVTSETTGTSAHHLQLWGPSLAIAKGDCLLLTFRARSSKPFHLPRCEVLRGNSPWTQFAVSNVDDRQIGSSWDTYQVVMDAADATDAGRLHISLGGILPDNAVLDLKCESIRKATRSISDPLSCDVGNIIFDDGAVCGWKKWSLDELSKPYEYYYDRASQRVFLYLDSPPASRHSRIELALARHIVNQGGKHHVTYANLALMYGAAHGFGGGDTHHLVIRDCDLGYIGGAHQLTTDDGHPVRFGNAIEFWGAAHDHLVEGCRIWEVYDAALTNQGRGPDSQQINITYQNNVIWNSEYSFEYWNGPESAVTKNIRFLHNTCVGAGRGWAHAQRPDPNGSHLMFYSNTAATSGIAIKYNIFFDHTDWGCRYSSGWDVLPEMDYNLWFSETGTMAYWFRDKIVGFDEYCQKTGLDHHSQFADPQFIDAARNDFRLSPDSPARSVQSESGPAGANVR
jgi:hypothetical protein